MKLSLVLCHLSLAILATSARVPDNHLPDIPKASDFANYYKSFSKLKERQMESDPAPTINNAPTIQSIVPVDSLQLRQAENDFTPTPTTSDPPTIQSIVPVDSLQLRDSNLEARTFPLYSGPIIPVNCLACISTPMTAFLGYPFVYSETPIGGRAAIAAFTGAMATCAKWGGPCAEEISGITAGGVATVKPIIQWMGHAMATNHYISEFYKFF